MKREFLTGLGLEAGVVDQIMTENGKDIEGLKLQLGVQKGLVSDLNGQLTTAQNTIKKYEGVDVDAITKERDTYKSQYEQALKDKDTAVAQVKYDSALDSYLSKYQFSSSFAKDGIRSALADKKLKLSDKGEFEGIEDAMKELQETHKDAFTSSGVGADKPKPQFSSQINGASSGMTNDEYLQSKYKDNPWMK